MYATASAFRQFAERRFERFADHMGEFGNERRGLQQRDSAFKRFDVARIVFDVIHDADYATPVMGILCVTR